PVLRGVRRDTHVLGDLLHGHVGAGVEQGFQLPSRKPSIEPASPALQLNRVVHLRVHLLISRQPLARRAASEIVLAALTCWALARLCLNVKELSVCLSRSIPRGAGRAFRYPLASWRLHQRCAWPVCAGVE